MGDVFDVDAAGGDVGGDEDVGRAASKSIERRLARTLAKIAVDRGDGKAALREVFRKLRGGALRAGEDDGCLLYTSPSPRDGLLSRMPSSA